MRGWRRNLVAFVGALGLLGASAASVAARGGGDLIEFDSMTPVTGAAVGTFNDRGIKGGGLPWAITSGSGEVDRQGNISVEVTGLVLAAGPNTGINPVTQFKAIVSCLTPNGTVNVSTGLFAASTAGDSTIEDQVALPHPCKQPIVFVTSPGGSWFAMSNADEEGD